MRRWAGDAGADLSVRLSIPLPAQLGHDGGDLREGRRVVVLVERHVDAEPVADAGRDLRDREGVTTEVEHVVVGSDDVHPEHLPPDGPDLCEQPVIGGDQVRFGR